MYAGLRGAVAFPVRRAYRRRMPRPLREFVPGAYYLLVTRGVNGRTAFLDDDDRRRFLALLSLAARRSAWNVHAWCSMSNHYHLLIEATTGEVSAALRLLNGW